LKLNKAYAGLRKSNDELLEAYGLLQQLATVDPLTGLENRCSLMDFAEVQLKLSQRYKSFFSIILIDLDYSGLIHVASNEVINKYLFHETILKQLSLDINYHKQISVDKKQLAARRPKFMALDNGLLAKIIGTEPPNLYDMISEEIKKSSSLKES
jgi:dTDP-4-dehydrorhamnose reductase